MNGVTLNNKHLKDEALTFSARSSLSVFLPRLSTYLHLLALLLCAVCLPLYFFPSLRLPPKAEVSDADTFVSLSRLQTAPAFRSHGCARGGR